MGTGGYTVYRYKRVKYAIRSDYDSYPEGLGVQVLSKIPKPSDGKRWKIRFEKWLDEHRAMMEKIIVGVTRGMSPEQVEAIRVRARDESEQELYFFNGKKEPLDMWAACYVWEMDLDNLCFWVNGFPLYRLDYLPTKKVFLNDCLAEKTFLTSNTKHAYVHKIIPRPSEEDPATLHNYSLSCAGTAPLYEILGVKETLSRTETLRLRWVEVLVGCAREPSGRCPTTELTIALELEANSGASTLEAISTNTCEKLKGLTYRIFRPYSYTYGSRHSFDSHKPRRTLPGCPNIYLLRHNTVFCIQNHLDNPNCLHTSSYNLFKAIMDNFSAPIAQEPFVYGVLFSGTRCAIVRVDRKAARFTHTTTIPFFPNDYRSRSSAGITALARLASKIDPDYFEIDSGFSEFARGPLSSRGGLFEKLPLELIDTIADFCSHNFLHLRKFAGISICTRDAALNVSARYIFIDGFRLVEAIDEINVSSGFDEEILNYLKAKESYSGLFFLKTAQNTRALCIVGYNHHRGYRYVCSTPFEPHTLPCANEMCYGLLTLEGKEMAHWMKVVLQPSFDF
ncbi:hypothetical protein L218DRAFT_1078251 [Marasmius fiardii PR-910]|nr:hypothetical protein L218DRAFT_1078251 [Marasmius fiardii PR-910]